MRYALVGAGRIAPNHIKSALQNHLEIVGICDKDIGKARRLAASFNLPESICYSDYRSMLLKTGNIGFVSVATDSGSHFPIVMDLFGLGCNVLCEKPIALSLSDADKMIATANKKRLVFGVCQQNRLNDASRMVKKAMDAGAFGKLSHGAVCVRWSRDEAYYAHDSWRGKWESAGGTLMNQCIHGLDLLRYLMGGDVEEAYGMIDNRLHPYMEVEDIGLALIRFRSGALATVEGTSNVFEDDLEETITLIGETGTIKLGGKAAEHILFWHFADKDVDGWCEKKCPQCFSSVYGNGHVRVFADFIRAVKEHGIPLVDGKAGRDALELVLAVYESAKQGKSVHIPFSVASTEDMKGFLLERKGM